MPVEPGDQLLGAVSPGIIARSWDRTGTFPGYPQLSVSVYDAIAIDLFIYYQTTEIPWIEIGGFSGNGYIDIVGQQFFVPVTKLDTSMLPNGEHKAVATFRFVPHTGNSFDVNVEIFLTLSGVEQGNIQPDKSTYNVLFNRASNTLTGDTVGSVLNNSEGKSFSLIQFPPIFKPQINFVKTFSFEDDPSNPLAQNPQLPFTGNFLQQCTLADNANAFGGMFSVNVLVVNEEGVGIGVLPSSLTFEVIKGTQEKSEGLTVNNPLGITYTIQSPEWLLASVLSGNTSQIVQFTTITTALQTGTYQDIIKFSFEGGFVDVPVTLHVNEFVIIDYTTEFCLDLPPVVVNKKTETAFFVKFTVTAVYWVMGAQSTVERVFMVPYFEDKVSFDLGGKVHRYFPRWKEDFFSLTQNADLMKKIKVGIVVEELAANRTVLFSQTVSDLSLLPGHKPAAFPVLSSLTHRKKNRGSILFTSVVEGDTVKVKKVNGDTIDVSADYGDTTIRYYEFPRSFHPVHLQWENGNLAPEWFTFTGDYRLSPEFTHIAGRSVFNAQSEKFEASAARTLFVNTGFIMAQEREMISKIIESRIAFVKIDDRVYRCINITKKNTELDSAEELSDRDLEFLIVEKWK